jgi:hypothetical protein
MRGVEEPPKLVALFKILGPKPPLAAAINVAVQRM